MVSIDNIPAYSGKAYIYIDNSNFALEKVPIHLENSIITGIKIA